MQPLPVVDLVDEVGQATVCLFERVVCLLLSLSAMMVANAFGRRYDGDAAPSDVNALASLAVFTRVGVSVGKCHTYVYHCRPHHGFGANVHLEQHRTWNRDLQYVCASISETPRVHKRSLCL